MEDTETEEGKTTDTSCFLPFKIWVKICNAATNDIYKQATILSTLPFKKYLKTHYYSFKIFDTFGEEMNNLFTKMINIDDNPDLYAQIVNNLCIITNESPNNRVNKLIQLKDKNIFNLLTEFPCEDRFSINKNVQTKLTEDLSHIMYLINQSFEDASPEMVYESYMIFGEKVFDLSDPHLKSKSYLYKFLPFFENKNFALDLAKHFLWYQEKEVLDFTSFIMKIAFKYDEPYLIQCLDNKKLFSLDSIYQNAWGYQCTEIIKYLSFKLRVIEKSINEYDILSEMYKLHSCVDKTQLILFLKKREVYIDFGRLLKLSIEHNETKMVENILNIYYTEIEDEDLYKLLEDVKMKDKYKNMLSTLLEIRLTSMADIVRETKFEKDGKENEVNLEKSSNENIETKEKNSNENIGKNSNEDIETKEKNSNENIGKNSNEDIETKEESSNENTEMKDKNIETKEKKETKNKIESVKEINESSSSGSNKEKEKEGVSPTQNIGNKTNKKEKEDS